MKISIANAILVVIGLLGTIVNNRIIVKKNQVKQAFGSIEIYLKKRFDLIPNLVAMFIKYLAQEKVFLVKVTQLRSQVTTAMEPKEKIIKKNRQILLALMLVMFYADAQTKDKDTNAILKAQLRLLQLGQDYDIKKDTIGFSKFKNSKFHSKNGDADVFAIDINNVHLVDFNNDGLKDIVYQEKQLHKATILLANNGNDFIEIWNGPGEPVFIKESEKTTISVYSPYVGCMEINMLYEVTVGANNEIKEDFLSYHHTTQLEKLDSTFKQKEVSGFLRMTPEEVNTETEDPCTGEQRPGNQIRAIEKQLVTVIRDGKHWLLVVYKSNNNSIIAWIKNK